MNEHQLLIIDLLTEFALDAQDWNKPYRKKAANAAIEWVNGQESEVKRLKDAIQLTIDENMDLADGDVCTLIHLKRAIGMD